METLDAYIFEAICMVVILLVIEIFYRFQRRKVQHYTIMCVDNCFIQDSKFQLQAQNEYDYIYKYNNRIFHLEFVVGYCGVIASNPVVIVSTAFQGSVFHATISGCIVSPVWFYFLRKRFYPKHMSLQHEKFVLKLNHTKTIPIDTQDKSVLHAFSFLLTEFRRVYIRDGIILVETVFQPPVTPEYIASISRALAVVAQEVEQKLSAISTKY